MALNLPALLFDAAAWKSVICRVARPKKPFLMSASRLPWVVKGSVPTPACFLIRRVTLVIVALSGMAAGVEVEDGDILLVGSVITHAQGGGCGIHGSAHITTSRRFEHPTITNPERTSTQARAGGEGPEGGLTSATVLPSGLTARTCQ